MADRFDEMARAWCERRNLARGDDEALAALLRKVHDEAIERWKAANGYDDLLTAYSAETSEANRLRKLFDDAGQGEHNVLALVDHYQRTAMEADERLLAARKVVEGLREYLATDIHVPRHINARRLDALAGLLAEYDKAVGG